MGSRLCTCGVRRTVSNDDIITNSQHENLEVAMTTTKPRQVKIRGGKPWGFRLSGNEPFKVTKVNPGSKSESAGIEIGEYVTAVNGVSTAMNSYKCRQRMKDTTYDSLRLELSRSPSSHSKTRSSSRFTPPAPRSRHQMKRPMNSQNGSTRTEKKRKKTSDKSLQKNQKAISGQPVSHKDHSTVCAKESSDLASDGLESDKVINKDDTISKKCNDAPTEVGIEPGVAVEGDKVINKDDTISKKCNDAPTEVGIEPGVAVEENYSKAGDTVTTTSKVKRTISKHLSLPKTQQSSEPICRLQNLGNTCFMNSALQCLSHTRPLVDYFVKPTCKYEADLNLESKHGMKGQLAKAFAELQDDMWFEHKPLVKPSKLKSVVGRFAPRFAGYSEEDAQEFITFLLDGLHEDLNKIKKKSYVRMTIDGEEDMSDKDVAEELWKRHQKRNLSKIVELFHGQIKSYTVCLDCKTTYRTFEPTLQLTLPIPSPKLQRASENYTARHSDARRGVTIEDCLELHFANKSMEWLCDLCQKMVPATRKYDIWMLPPILIVHLKRFSVDKYENTKVNTEVSYPLRLNLSKYFSTGACASKDAIYDLYAVVKHEGTLLSGHYTAYVKENSEWYWCSDTMISKVDVSEVQTSGAYVLFYQSNPKVHRSSF